MKFKEKQEKTTKKKEHEKINKKQGGLINFQLYFSKSIEQMLIKLPIAKNFPHGSERCRLF